MDTQEKIRENRARRAVARRATGWPKTRRRDRPAYDYGSWKITDPPTGALVHAAPSLTDIEAWLDRSAR